ncbi:hypothetical protein [Haladaptatus halobius]|uniref:hypothetical protein n=1 Tax=Haladaptatus halobius TaxID=2884875 RepID=UPI001D0B49BB|nr:hypothetical protein [Haladaptatus halobius]
MAQENSTKQTVKKFTQSYSEEGLATLLIVLGTILFVFPEPITSVTGVILLLIGAALWFTDWVWG